MLFALSGCAVHASGVEHYVGPVLFRFRPATETTGGVSQIVRGGVLVDAGRQWGLAAGMTERLAVVSTIVSRGGPNVETQRWITPIGLFGDPVPGRWNFSPFYLRVEGMAGAIFIRRQAYGIEMTSGTEARAASIGWTSRTLLLPPDDVVSVVRFDSRRPLDTVVAIWPADIEPDQALLASPEESNP